MEFPFLYTLLGCAKTVFLFRPFDLTSCNLSHSYFIIQGLYNRLRTLSRPLLLAFILFLFFHLLL